jgi:hypothetical protein
MGTVLAVVTDVAVCGSLALLLWGAALCLAELFGSAFGTRAPDGEQDLEGSRRWFAGSRIEQG